MSMIGATGSTGSTGPTRLIGITGPTGPMGSVRPIGDLNIDVTLEIDIQLFNGGEYLVFLFTSIASNEMVEMTFHVKFGDNINILDELMVNKTVYKGKCVDKLIRLKKATSSNASIAFTVYWGEESGPESAVIQARNGLLEDISRQVIVPVPEIHYPGIDQFLRDGLENRRKVVLDATIGKILNFASQEEIQEAIQHNIVKQVIES